jgi:hypothetical protein
MTPKWPTRRKAEEHFFNHGQEVGASTVEEYEASAIETIRVGRPFQYVDRTTGKRHLGYFDPPTGRFAGLDRRGRRIFTHFVPDEGEEYVRNLPHSDYT